MDGDIVRSEQFEANRAHLRGVAYRILGDWEEADDAVQESWLRLNRSDGGEITNLAGWLTTVVSRVCLDMLRSRKARREELLEVDHIDRLSEEEAGGNPEQDVVLADAIGIALLMLLDVLKPEERIAFVLHDVFAIPYAEIGAIVGKSEPATRKLASRARRRIQGAREAAATSPDVQQRLVNSFLAAAREGDFEALLAVLDPRVVLHSDRKDTPEVIIGRRAVAEQLMGGRAAAAYASMVNGRVGVEVSPGGSLLLVLELSYANDKIVGVEVISDAARFPGLKLARLEE